MERNQDGLSECLWGSRLPCLKSRLARCDRILGEPDGSHSGLLLLGLCGFTGKAGTSDPQTYDKGQPCRVSILV